RGTSCLKYALLTARDSKSYPQSHLWAVSGLNSPQRGHSTPAMTPSLSLDAQAEPAPLSFDGARGEARDVILHEERVDEGDGNGAQERPGHQLAPVEGVATDQLAHHADRHGAHARLAEEEEG